jgi:polysaccharide biosynthesis transport protein
MPEELDQALDNLGSYWAVVCRRRWWILIPALLVWLAVWGIGYIWPPTYQSEALILLNQQIVPNQYVTPNVSASPQDRLRILSQQLLSRTRLQATIDRFHLYPEAHGFDLLLMPGDPIDRMRKDVEIELVANPGHPDEVTAFRMRYSARTAELAQAVNEDLTSPFVNDNVEAQQHLSEETTAFLDKELADARARMEEQESRVAAFKAKHLGELPGQLDANTQQLLTGIQSQLQSSHEALDSAKQQRLYLESMLRQYQSAQANTSAAGGDSGAAGGVTESAAATVKLLEKELMELRLHLQDLQERYTDDYPEVVSLKDTIGKKEIQRKRAEDAAAASERLHKTASAASSAAMRETQNGPSAALMQLESQIKANQEEIENYQKHERDLESQVSAYLDRLKMAPQAEQDLAEISRGYEESKANYNSLLQKQMQSQLATSLEERQKGEQFRVLDPPSLPKKKLGPNRFKFSIAGLFAGVAIGFGIVLVLELMDIRIRHERDLKAFVPVPVIVSIPRLTTQKEEKSQSLVQWLDLGAVTITIALLAAGNIYAFFRH